MTGYLILVTLLVVGLIIGLEYVIRHACMPPGPNQWTWDQWDWVTVGIAVFLGIVTALFLACKSSYKMTYSSWPMGASSSAGLSSPSTLSGVSELYPPTPMPMQVEPVVAAPLPIERPPVAVNTSSVFENPISSSLAPSSNFSGLSPPQ